MPNWCTNDFHIRLASAAEVKMVLGAVDAFEADDEDALHPLLALLKYRGLPEDEVDDLRYRTSGDLHIEAAPSRGEHDMTGWDSSAWSPPEDLIAVLQDQGILQKWAFCEFGTQMMGVYWDSPGSLEEGDCESIEEYEEMMEDEHPFAYDGWRCTAQPGDLVANTDIVFGLCIRPGVIRLFDGGDEHFGQMVKGVWRFLDSDVEDFEHTPRNRTPGDGVEVNLTNAKQRKAKQSKTVE